MCFVFKGNHIIICNLIKKIIDQPLFFVVFGKNCNTFLHVKKNSIFSSNTGCLIHLTWSIFNNIKYLIGFEAEKNL
jgi:hypothetical protein